MAEFNHDIERYQNGDLTPAEMHALERKALNDPFLADALDGGAGIDTADFSKDVKKLRSQLADRVQSPGRSKIVPLWTMIGRIAAGLLLLAVSGYIVLSLLERQDKPPELAMTKPAVQPQPVPPAKKDEALTASEPEKGTSQHYKFEESKPAPVKAEPVVSEQQEQAISGTGNMDEINPPIIRDDVTASDVEDTDLKEKEVLQDVTMAAPVPEEKFEAKDKAAKREERGRVVVQPSSGLASTSISKKSASEKTSVSVVRGTVTDAADGSPLPGVNVLIKGSNAGVVTDAEGHYQIPLEDLSQELVFSFIGLQAVDVPVNNNENIDVKMEQDVSQLSEVVVVGYTGPGDDVEKKMDNPNIYQLAEPAGGRKAFKKYLVDNMHYPEQAIDNKIQGKVTIQFTVGTSGTINDFKVIKGIGYGCDEEVIRLVRQGPAWTPTTRNDVPLKGKVKVRLRFQLPD